MKFSIIIPFKNVGGNFKYLNDCISSLKEQTYKNFEVILLHSLNNNHFNDLFRNSSLEYKLFKMGQNKNLANYRNEGIRQSVGEYIIFLDADDFLHRNALIYARQMINSEENDQKVFKFGIRNTNLDRDSTLLKSKKDLYSDESISKMMSFLENKGILSSNNTSQDLLNELFENNILNHNYQKIYIDQLNRKLNYRSKAHGLIVEKEFLLRNNIFFDSNNYLYSDIPFVYKLYEVSGTICQTNTKLYYKYIHNDPINTPSLSQENHYDRLLQLITAYREALEAVSNSILEGRLKTDAARTYLYRVVKDNNFEEKNHVLGSIYHELYKIFNINCSNYNIKKLHRYEVDAIKNGKFTRAYLLSKGRVFAYNSYKFSDKKNERYRKKIVQKYVFKKLPIQKQTILYESFLGRNYSDSPKALFNYLLENEPNKWKHIWILNDKELVKNETEFNNNNVKVIKRFGWKYFYYATVSKYFILNMRQPKWLEKKNEQVILSTWHGTPLKKLVFDMENVTSANKNYKKDFFLQSRNWNYLIAANKYSENIFESAFMYPRENILTYGYPRNDILTNHDKNYKIRIKEKFNIPLNKKVILYAPTWRDDDFYAVGKYKFNLKLDLEKMKKEFGDQYVIVLRMHYLVSENIDLSMYDEFVYDYSKYNDINDLYIASDILITDYSSVFFDYSILKKPILFYMYDIEKYQNILRGFYINVNEELPGPILQTNDEVIHAIKNIDKVSLKFDEKYNNFIDKYCSLEDGRASERVIKKVVR